MLTDDDDGGGGEGEAGVEEHQRVINVTFLLFSILSSKKDHLNLFRCMPFLPQSTGARDTFYSFSSELFHLLLSLRGTSGQEGRSVWEEGNPRKLNEQESPRLRWRRKIECRQHFPYYTDYEMKS